MLKPGFTKLIEHNGYSMFMLNDECRLIVNSSDKFDILVKLSGRVIICIGGDIIDTCVRELCVPRVEVTQFYSCVCIEPGLIVASFELCLAFVAHAFSALTEYAVGHTNHSLSSIINLWNTGIIEIEETPGRFLASFYGNKFIKKITSGELVLSIINNGSKDEVRHLCDFYERRDYADEMLNYLHKCPLAAFEFSLSVIWRMSKTELIVPSVSYHRKIDKHDMDTILSKFYMDRIHVSADGRIELVDSVNHTRVFIFVDENKNVCMKTVTYKELITYTVCDWYIEKFYIRSGFKFAHGRYTGSRVPIKICQYYLKALLSMCHVRRIINALGDHMNLTETWCAMSDPEVIKNGPMPKSVIVGTNVYFRSPYMSKEHATGTTWTPWDIVYNALTD